jgi:hypothetical protein
LKLVFELSATGHSQLPLNASHPATRTSSLKLLAGIPVTVADTSGDAAPCCQYGAPCKPAFDLIDENGTPTILLPGESAKFVLTHASAQTNDTAAEMTITMTM